MIKPGDLVYFANEKQYGWYGVSGRVVEVNSGKYVYIKPDPESVQKINNLFGRNYIIDKTWMFYAEDLDFVEDFELEFSI